MVEIARFELTCLLGAGFTVQCNNAIVAVSPNYFYKFLKNMCCFAAYVFIILHTVCYVNSYLTYNR